MINIELLQMTINDMIVATWAFLPKLLTTFVILLFGWVVGRVLATLTRRLTNKAGLDNLLQRTGIRAGLERAQIKQSGPDLFALFIFWIIFLNFLLVGLENLGLGTAVEPLRNLITFLPRLLAAMITLTGGLLLAQFLGRAAQAAMSGMGVEFHQEVGQGVNILLVIVLITVVLEQLGVNTTIITTLFTNILTVIVAGLALAFGLGGRQLARNVLAGHYIREQFAVGDAIEIEGQVGQLVSVGTLNSEIALITERLIVPNTMLTETTVKIKSPLVQEELPY